MTCGIYKITNKINGKVYIGQSINIEQRWREHKSRYLSIDEKEYNKPLYNAIRKYGLQNFEFFIIEECSQEQLNEKEIYWIDSYEALDKNKGYNISRGSQPPIKYTKLDDIKYYNLCKDLKENILSIDDLCEKYDITFGYIYEINRGEDKRKNNKEFYPLRPKISQVNLNEETVINIKKDLLQGKPVEEIKNKYKISRATVDNINYGRRHSKENENYPLHNYNNDIILSETQVKEIIELISKTKMTFKEIGKLYNKSDSCISDINQGKSFYNKNLNYPLRLNKRKFLTEEEILEIYNLLLNSSFSLEEIRNKYGIGKITLYYINTGYTHKHNGYKYPLRK